MMFWHWVTFGLGIPVGVALAHIYAICDDRQFSRERKDWHAALREPLLELVIAYQDADSPAIQDTLRRARLALAMSPSERETQ